MEIINSSIEEMNYMEDIGELIEVIYQDNKLKAPIGVTCINTDDNGYITAWNGFDPSVIKYNKNIGMWCNTSKDPATVTFIGKAKVGTFIPEETM